MIGYSMRSLRFVTLVKARYFSSKLVAPPLVYIAGEEMTRVAGELFLNEWIRPYIDTSKWEYFDLSCTSRDATDDEVLRQCISAGNRIGAIYKEPTITPTSAQVKSMGLKKALGSPNGAMRSGWNGVSISRDTIHIPGLQLGYQRPCLFDRHAVGGEYEAGYSTVSRGTLITSFLSPNGSSIVVDERELTDDVSAVVVYDNPYDNVTPMAHHFFSRCLTAEVKPCVVTKKTVFKWQETFWETMRSVFNESYKSRFVSAGILKDGEELQHFLTDVASMQVVRWSAGGWGMAAHNYDGDLLTDEIAQVHRSPGFLTSVLNGVRSDGSIIKEFEASHGTVTDMYLAHVRGEETSLNPLSMMEALLGAIEHSVALSKSSKDHTLLLEFTARLRQAIHTQMATPNGGTRDLYGAKGLTTEQFVAAVRERLDGKQPLVAEIKENVSLKDAYEYDRQKMREMFDSIDTDHSGRINFDEFVVAMLKLGITPRKVH